MNNRDIKKFKELIKKCCRVAEGEGCLDLKEWDFIDKTIETLLEECEG